MIQVFNEPHLNTVDLSALGIKIGDKFVVESDKNELSIKYGTDYSSVPEGRCVAFESAEGWLKFVCNRGDLSARLKIGKEDILIVKPATD